MSKPFRITWGRRFVLFIARLLLRLRYRIEVSGLEEVRSGGRKRILFLSSHPALIDPVMLTALLYRDFGPRSLADEWQISRPLLGGIVRKFGVRALPNLERRGATDLEATREALRETIEGLRGSENLLLYPAGRLKRARLEEIGATSGVEAIVKDVPGLRVVLVRQNGLWGSSFSFGFSGHPPHFVASLFRALMYLLGNGLFFMPRRRVTIQFVEPADFPREAGRLAINRYLEVFFNAGAWANTWVPYGFWQRGGSRERPDPEHTKGTGEAASVPAGTRRLVLDHLAVVAGKRDPGETERLGADLGMDSLMIAELVGWVEKEFGFSVGTPESLRTVADVLMAATGAGISAREMDLNPPGARWFQRARGTETLASPEGATITEVFLKQAAAHPSRVVLADQMSGERSYRDLVAAVILLKPVLEKMPGPTVGIMMPASVGAAAFYLACLFAGKTPVMINWTTGSRFLKHSLDLLGVRRVVTARALLSKLQSLGTDLSGIEDRFVFAEEIRAGMTPVGKLIALVKSRVSWRDLRRAHPPAEAMILFTSGSESLPKAVPLSHGNILANIRDIPRMVTLSESDALLGMLPPFHSFGIVVTTIMPLCLGLRTVFHANPTEASILAKIIESYGVTVMVGTPTFLAGILRAAGDGQLRSLRIAVTGAETCPHELVESLGRRCPDLKVIEGYGITECSPVVAANPESALNPSSIGSLLPSVEGAIVNQETGERVSPGKAGILLVRGPSIFSGYLNYDGPSPFVMFEGRQWYRTGDLIRQGEDGALFFEGRLSRFVKLGGEMISLPAIESVLSSHFPLEGNDGPVIAVDAIGSGDKAEIVLYACRQTDRDQVNGWLRAAGMSPLHNVRQVIRVDSIPVLGTGKTDYRSLKALPVAQETVRNGKKKS